MSDTKNEAHKPSPIIPGALRHSRQGSHLLFHRSMFAFTQRYHSFPAMPGPVFHCGCSESRPEVSVSEWSRNRAAHHFCHHKRYSIIKRRVAWFIGKWISGECSPANNPRIWEIFVHLLQDQKSSTEMAVRLTAASALRVCIDVRIVEILRCGQENANFDLPDPFI
jgi:hypothetical protein